MMNCPNCQREFSVYAYEDNIMHTGMWYGKYECKYCGTYIESMGQDFEDLLMKLDAQVNGEWKKYQ